MTSLYSSRLYFCLVLLVSVTLLVFMTEGPLSDESLVWAASCPLFSGDFGPVANFWDTGTVVDVFLRPFNRDLLLQLSFVFNIYVLAVVITAISSVRRVITNDQMLTEYSRLYISNTFISFLAVPNKAVFCVTPTLHVISSFPIRLSNSAETLPRAPITTGTISTFLNFHNLLIPFFKSWYFSTFSFSFSSSLTSAGTAISIIIPFCSFLSITIRLSHWVFMSHSTLISSFSTAPSGACSYHFPLCSNQFFSQISQ